MHATTTCLALGSLLLAACLSTEEAAVDDADTAAPAELVMVGDTPNYARTSYGGVASASSTASANIAAKVNDGSRSGSTYWAAGTLPDVIDESGFRSVYSNPPWVQVDLGQSRNIGEVDVFLAGPATAPTLVSGLGAGGVKGFEVQYRSGAGPWVSLGQVADNTKQRVRLQFQEISARYVRVLVNATYPVRGAAARAQIAEVEVYGGAPSCSRCDTSSSPSIENRCKDDAGRYTTCLNFGTFDPGTTGCYAQCTTTLRSCDFTCTDFEGATNTCFNLRLGCSDVTAASYPTGAVLDIAPPCDTFCTVAGSDCDQRCAPPGATNYQQATTCGDYSKSLGVRTCASYLATTGDSQVFTKPASGGMSVRSHGVDYYLSRAVYDRWLDRTSVTPSDQTLNLSALEGFGGALAVVGAPVTSSTSSGSSGGRVADFRSVIDLGSPDPATGTYHWFAASASNRPTARIYEMGQPTGGPSTVVLGGPLAHGYITNPANPSREPGAEVRGPLGAPLASETFDTCGFNCRRTVNFTSGRATGCPANPEGFGTNYCHEPESVPHYGSRFWYGKDFLLNPVCSEFACKAPGTHLQTAERRDVRCLVPTTGVEVFCEDWLRDFVDDGDMDDLPDALETSLFETFAPSVHWFFADEELIYGAPPTQHAYGGPFGAVVVRPVTGAGGGINCGAVGNPSDVRCIEVLYSLAYNWDKGDPETSGFYEGAHHGDGELVAVLLAREDPFHPDPQWGATWATARTDASRWRIVARYLSAHHDKGVFDSCTSETYPAGAMVNEVWAAKNKHANYASVGACDSGGLNFDNCDQNTVQGRPRFRNAGERFAHSPARFLVDMPAPGATPTTPATGTGSGPWKNTPFGSGSPLLYEFLPGAITWLSTWKGLQAELPLWATSQHPELLP